MTDLSQDIVRVRLDLSYDGTDFHGWARQVQLRTVQGELEEALERLVRVPVALTVAGRTDAGVHARGQVAHVDLPRAAWERLPGRSGRTPGQALATKLTALTGEDVVVHTASLAPAGFDARFCALERRYVYRIAEASSPRDPLARRGQWWLDRDVDVQRADQVSSALLGLRDFAAFCKHRDSATTIRTLLELTWTRPDSGPDRGIVCATVRADAFCHSMVRSLVGAVTAVATGQRSAQWLADVAATATRSEAVYVAPAAGLTLEEVVYPPDAELGARATAVRAKRTLS